MINMSIFCLIYILIQICLTILNTVLLILAQMKIHNYDTNKFSKFFVNDIKWKSFSTNYLKNFDGHFLGQIKNVNYEAKKYFYL